MHTDHSSLSWLMKGKDPTGHLACWALQVQQYDFHIIHHPGLQNGATDAYLDIPTRSLSVESQSVFAPLAPLEHLCPPPVNLHTLQLQDPDISVIISYLETTALPTDDAKA